MKPRKTDITSTRHILPFENLSPDQFTRLCHWIVERSSDFDSVEYYDLSGDKNRDVIAYKVAKKGKRKKWYFQCKRYKKISFSAFRDELEAIKKHSDEDAEFKPDMIVFVTGCSVSPSCKDEVKNYAKSLSLGFVAFWTNIELDEKAKSTEGVLEEFFTGGINTEEIAEKVAEKVDMRLDARLQLSGQISMADSIKTDEINKEIDEAVTSMYAGKIEEAKSSLYIILGKIKDRPMQCKEELARVYNNLGVCFNRFGVDGGDYDKAKQYFELALNTKPDSSKLKANLASVFLHIGGLENFKKAYEISHVLWNDSDKKDPLFIQMLIWSIYHYQSSKKAIEFYEKSEEAQPLVDDNEELLYLMGMMYFETNDFKKAEELVEVALDLNPNSPQCLLLKARVLMARSERDKVIPSVFDVVPRFRDYKNIEIALKLLERALEILKNENNRFLEEQIKTDILLCLLWLRRAKDALYRDIRESIDISRLEPHQKRQLRIRDMAVQLQVRNFETAYNMLTQATDWTQRDYWDKTRIAHIFLLKGAPQQSKEILKQLEAEAEQKKDIQFWADMSLIEVLLNNKNLAIKAAQKAKDLSKGTEAEKTILSHFNALMMRYASSGEADRFVGGIFDYDKKYPEDKSVWSVKALDDQGKLTREVKSILLKQKNWYEDIRQTFKSQTIPSFYLEDIFKRPYAEILSSQNDPEFMIELTVPNAEFEEELTNNLEKSDQVVLGYASLLNLSKMNLLGHLEKFGKHFYISEELFDKVQRELISFEHEDIRRLWSFLRSSKEIHIMDEIKGVLKDVKTAELFDPWIIASIKLAREKNAVYITDDLRFLQFLRSEDVTGCNSLILLKYMLKQKWIDSKVYSISIGDLAERLYIFLGFSGDDLFQIVIEDEAKITLRTYHLVNQLFLGGSIATSFTGVFVKFIYLLWKTGSLPDKKVQWLIFLTNTVLEFIDKQGGVTNTEELKKVGPDFVQMWLIAIKESNKSEIELLEEKAEEILIKPYLNVLKDHIKRLIEKKKDALGVLS